MRRNAVPRPPRASWSGTTLFDVPSPFLDGACGPGGVVPFGKRSPKPSLAADPHSSQSDRPLASGAVGRPFESGHGHTERVAGTGHPLPAFKARNRTTARNVDKCEPAAQKACAMLREPASHDHPDSRLRSGRSRMSNARILVVDDDQVIQQLLKVNLELEGYAVEVASDGEEALVLFDRFRPDLVLLDIMMPKLDGWEVARRLAGTSGGPVPIVLLSARAQESDVQKGNDLGVAAYVTKPFDPIQLLHLVAGIIAQQDRGAATPGV